MSEATEATKVLEGIKSLTAEEPPVLNVQAAIVEAATRKVVEALSAQPPAEHERLPEADAVSAVVSGKTPATISAPVEAVPPQQAQREDGAITLSGEVVSLLKATLKANLLDVTAKVLRIMLECED
jgi:hypothetical protein